MYLDSETLAKIANVEREVFPPDCQIEFIGSDREFDIVPVGSKGVVCCIDNTGNILASWEDGKEHRLIYGVDFWKRI